MQRHHGCLNRKSKLSDVQAPHPIPNSQPLERQRDHQPNRPIGWAGAASTSAANSNVVVVSYHKASLHKGF